MRRFEMPCGATRDYIGGPYGIYTMHIILIILYQKICQIRYSAITHACAKILESSTTAKGTQSEYYLVVMMP